MTLDQFRQLAEIWGGDIDRWPQATQAAARDVAGSDEGGRILEEQLALDRLFAIAPEVSDDRAAQISFAVLQALAKTDRGLPWWRRLFRPVSLFPAASLASSAVVGLWLAAALPYQQQDEEALSVVSMVFDSSAVTLWGMR
jgi:hypothetical protein